MARNYQKRFNFVDRVCSSFEKWQGPLPNLRDIFCREEIDWLLAESIELHHIDGIVDPRQLVDFLIKTGYKDEPEDGEDRGKPSSAVRRTTPIHHAAMSPLSSVNFVIPQLFTMYDRFDVNYSDEYGYTHFHVACRHGLVDVVKKFLDHGQDPNLLLPNTGDSPLRLALKSGRNQVLELLLSNGADPNSANNDGRTLLHLILDVDTVKMLFELSKDRPIQIDPRDNWGNTPLHLAMREHDIKMMEFLLRRGADPNAVNEAGSTPLHVACKGYPNGLKSMEIFFKINEEVDRTVRVDARDNSGRTPLQWAVANLRPNCVGLLLDRGADLSDFVHPTENYYGDRYERIVGCSPSSKLEMASGALLEIEILEAGGGGGGGGGYELNRDDALTIMKFYAKHELFEKPADPEKKYWVDDEEFAREAKAIRIKPSLSLYDLIRSRPAEAAKQLTYRDYYDLADPWRFRRTFVRHKEACMVRLCEMTSRGFFRRWALDPLLQLTHYQLPILCCDKILDKLMNKDLYHICLAATSQN